jgi:hypothetical protein
VTPPWLALVRAARGCGGDGQPTQFVPALYLRALGDGLDVVLDELPRAQESAEDVVPAGFDLGHQVGCVEPYYVPLAGLAISGRVRLIGRVPVDDVADDVMHGRTSLTARCLRVCLGSAT